MTGKERIRDAAQGLAVDRPPISFWQHFPTVDQNPETLTKALLEFQSRYRLDLVKLMPSGMYSVVDYGAVTSPPDPISGARGLASGPIDGPASFASLPPSDPGRGALAAELQVVREIRANVASATPVLETLFSPLTMAAKLSGLGVPELAATGGAALHLALAQFAEDTVRYARACLEAGVDGFFFATQWAIKGALSAAAGSEFGTQYDLQVLQQLRPTADLLMLHLHGSDPLFELSSQYPIDWVNWEDGETPPPLGEALSLTDRGLAGGFARTQAWLTGDPGRAIEHMRGALQATGGRRFMFAPGCVLPQNTDESVLLTLRDAVEDMTANA
ncbi:MAG TPA: uroporphyrinogen decarboxylase family protein [Candidatus Dormibacteraeota bacterium]|nr:uroporphyrinogen decarboxylase family protein [Candidatus Dormibacteraeota bacterium]